MSGTGIIIEDFVICPYPKPPRSEFRSNYKCLQRKYRVYSIRAHDLNVFVSKRKVAKLIIILIPCILTPAYYVQTAVRLYQEHAQSTNSPTMVDDLEQITYFLRSITTREGERER